MVVTKALRARVCANCRISLLQSFTSVAGPFRVHHVAARPSGSSISIEQLRHSSRLSEGRLQGEATFHESTRTGLFEEDSEEFLENGEESSPNVELSAVPWYLQVDAPPKRPQLLSERQQMPTLPESPPEILQPLLQQISIDLGLDSLSLFDLRKLDPPPALGANLLMIIGTARSEKHLHVSADRLCRWLRSTYKLRPDADGLLGRNELKLKLRRKAKRAKLIGNLDETGDDGVRTGWVCVDVGVVEGTENPSAVSEPHGFVGFGRRTDGVRIVVQMLTEEKREEIDLERLWGGILERGLQADVENTESANLTDSLRNGTMEQSLPSSNTTISSNVVEKGPFSNSGQTRGFHAVARRLSAAPGILIKEPNQRTNIPDYGRVELEDIRKSTIAFIVSGDFENAKNYLIRVSDSIPILKDEGWRPFLLNQLRTYLEKLPKERALQELGTGHTDPDSTSFLRCFHQTRSMFPSQEEAEVTLWLQCYARLRGHPYYSASGLLTLFRQLQSSGVKLSLSSYETLLRSIIRPEAGHSNYHGPSRFVVEGAMEILQAMYEQGLPILTEEILVELQKSFTPEHIGNPPAHTIYIDSDDAFDLPSLPMSPAQRRLHELMVSIELPCFNDKSRSQLLEMLARQQNWLQFWDIWRMAARRGMPQSAGMYELMFGLVANTGNQKACMAVLRTWIDNMDREDPVVKLQGSLAESVKACLRFADPFVEREAIDSPNMKGEWLSLWRRCQGSTESSQD